jgi:hypothetical protein
MDLLKLKQLEINLQNLDTRNLFTVQELEDIDELKKVLQHSTSYLCRSVDDDLKKISEFGIPIRYMTLLSICNIYQYHNNQSAIHQTPTLNEPLF